MIRVIDLSFGYTKEKPILEHINLNINPGDFILLKGPSGSGKSTFLRILNRLLAPQSGEIFYKGRSVRTYDAVCLRRKVVYLQQIPVMFDGSVKSNLILPFQFKSATESQVPNDAILKENLTRFLLKGVSLEDNAQDLSVGQKQRLALIRALLLNPDVLLLDEPTASLDEKSADVVGERTEFLNAEKGTTIIMVSHADYVPKTLTPRVLVLNEGVLYESTLMEMKQ